MAIIGHSILGDVTYEPKGVLDSDADVKQSQSERVTCERMCLHAHKLSLPLTDGKMRSFVAPDPFLYQESSSASNGHGNFILKSSQIQTDT